jgi:hypothetical protein
MTTSSLTTSRIEIDPAAPYFRAGSRRWMPTGWCSVRPDFLQRGELARMAAAGCDMVRLWPDHNESGSLAPNLADVIGEAERLGIRCLITLLNLGELSDTFIDKPNLKRIRGNAYREICDTPAELLTTEAAKDVSRRRIDACLDLVGDSPAVFGWVVCSQIDSIYQVPLSVYGDFAAEMGEYLRAAEERRYGFHRPRTLTSYDPLPVGDAFYRDEHLDLLGMHCYTPAVYTPVDTLQAAWETAVATAAACRRRPSGRPVHCVEYGPIQHQFVPDSPPLPLDLLNGYRRSTAFAHVCAGGAGAPLMIPARPAHGETMLNAEREGVTDQIRAMPSAIDDELLGAETVIRRVLDDPGWQHLDGTPAGLRIDGVLAAACGAGDGSAVAWLAADNRALQRQILLTRALDDDPAVDPLLGYDAAVAAVELSGVRLWNPVSRVLIAKLLDRGLVDVARQRVRAELDKLSSLITEADLPAPAATLGGVKATLPGDTGARRYRCYDAVSGDVVAEGTTRGDVELPDLPEVVVVADPIR